MADVTLQVNVAASDLRHAEHTLRHQLRQWRGQVSEVVYTLDTRKSAGPRGARFEEQLPGMKALLGRLSGQDDACRIEEVNYGLEAVESVSRVFFGGADVPAKDCFGAPFLAYFASLLSARNRFVLHMDCDMLFGGGSSNWLDEAIQVFEQRPEVAFMAPLAGPPTDDGLLPRKVRRGQRATQLFGSEPQLERHDPLTYRLRHVSSRIFLMDLERFRGALCPLAPLPAPKWTHGAALPETPFLPAETVMSRSMQVNGMIRLDMLGSGPGMWFLHPRWRTETFYERLPKLISELDAGRVPPGQHGDYELHADVVGDVDPDLVDPAWRRAARSMRVLDIRQTWRRWRWMRALPPR
jgi:hypothetical protein